MTIVLVLIGVLGLYIVYLHLRIKSFEKLLILLSDTVHDMVELLKKQYCKDNNDKKS